MFLCLIYEFQVYVHIWITILLSNPTIAVTLLMDVRMTGTSVILSMNVSINIIYQAIGVDVQKIK